MKKSSQLRFCIFGFVAFLFLNTFIFSCSPAQNRTKPPGIDKFDKDPKGNEQNEVPVQNLEMWHLKSPDAGFEGISFDQIQSATNLTQSEVIVAVIDSGVDISHNSLKNKIWINAGESGFDTNGLDKSNNKIDDDKNGYVDDVNGWNFLGNSNGENVDSDTLEITREALRYDKKINSGESLSGEEKIYFEAVKKEYESDVASAQAVYDRASSLFTATVEAEKLLKEKLGLVVVTKADLEKIESDQKDILDAKTHLLAIFAEYRSVARFYRVLNNSKNSLEFLYNKNFDPRRDITKNDDTDFSEFNYGNNNVIGPDSSHGTHVAGIIAAELTSESKVQGVSSSTKIMVLRAVPNGDERDKDIVAAVQYAVRMGAKIINMSFGKGFSPYKAEVDKAFLLAEKSGVLLVHAAGNSSLNLDQAQNFPNRKLQNQFILDRDPQIQTWLEVGASAPKKGLDLLAVFSNYGSKSVDLFAPGSQILSTVPDQKFAAFNGTSMASPVVAGSAAFLMNRFSGINAVQVKNILVDQVRTNYDRVRIPGALVYDVPSPLAKLSITGGILDLKNSVLMAESLLPKK